MKEERERNKQQVYITFKVPMIENRNAHRILMGKIEGK
jgi:hypothetical protein